VDQKHSAKSSLGCDSVRSMRVRALRAPLVAALLAGPWATVVVRSEPTTCPPTARGAVTDTLHGVPVADPYRWMESLDSPETRTWLDGERACTDRVLGAQPGRERIVAGMLEAYDYEKVSAPVSRGRLTFYTRNAGLQDQTILYVARGDSTPRILLDPNQLSPDGRLAFKSFRVSPRGRYVAYGLSAAGGDWTEWRVREVATGRDLPDRIEWTKYYEPSWDAGETGFFYSAFPKPAEGAELTAPDVGCSVRFHRLGTPAGSDPIFFARPELRTLQFEPRVTDDGRWLVITAGDGQVGDRGLEEIHVLDLERVAEGPRALVRGFDAEYVLVGQRGEVFFLLTNRDAPRRRVVAVDARDPRPSRWSTVVPEGEHAIEAVVRAGDRLVVNRLVDARSSVSMVGLDGRALGEVGLPGIGSVTLAEGEARRDAFEYTFTSFTTPPTVYRHDPASGRTTTFHAPHSTMDAADYVVEEEFVPGRDGVRIPVFVARRAGVALDGEAPALLTGYGGFANDVGPGFDALHAWWLRRGGVLAVACLRGGAEYGEAWHQAAVRTRKQTTFDDFLATAEWLVAHRYTRPGRLVITGASNGGLLVGAALTQRPDLFGAAVVRVGVLDMLRFHLVGQGRGWQGDYGSVDVPEEFRALLAYSPVHNLHPGTTYPATVVVTGDHDTRVAPWHSFKFTAALQAAQGGPAPILLKIDDTAGHGGGTRLRARVEDNASVYAFVLGALGVTP
jgi:prolyl oligopeptidase